MNATEQRTHRTVTTELRAQLEEVAVVLEALDARITQSGNAILAALADERRVRLGQAEDHRAALDRALTELHQQIAALQDRDWRGRLRWLFVGR